MAIALGCLRGFLLVQLTLSSGKLVYLFEIERKSEHEGFNGLMFRMPEGKLSNSAITMLLTRTALNKGKARKRVTRGKMEDLQFPVIDYLIYDHSLVEGSMVKKMKKVL